MIHIELTIQRRHLIIIVGALLSALMLIPGVAWASHSFTDVPDSDWAHADIGWLKDNGLTVGCGNGTTYCPNDNVTRREMAAFMHRLSGSDSTTLDARLDALEATLEGVSRNGDILLFDGMNIQLINGQGSTPTTNGLGNLIIGYNSTQVGDSRTGSHMLVVGDYHSYTSFAGVIAGHNNETSGSYASVTGGNDNTASGNYSSVTGGQGNTASVAGSSVSGGIGNSASGLYSSVTGGISNTASSSSSSVSGGHSNSANASFSTVTGGNDNTVGGRYSSVTGGRDNNVVREYSTIAGGYSNQITNGSYGAILGGYNNTVSAQYGTTLGGKDNILTGIYAAIGGGDLVICSNNASYFCAEGAITAAD